MGDAENNNNNDDDCYYASPVVHTSWDSGWLWTDHDVVSEDAVALTMVFEVAAAAAVSKAPK